MNYCSLCGNKIIIEIPDGDNRERYVCQNCRTIHYQNPKIVAGCLPLWENRILFCRRAIQPRHGMWTLPAGFMENDETVLQAALRECQEEACASIIEPQLYGIYNIVGVNQVYVMFLGQLKSADAFGVGSESSEVQLLDESEIPWDSIAFRVIERTLRRFLEERKTGRYSVVHEDI